ncbi:helix-turn-helix domain-containing protein [Hydrogenophaga sp. T2]|uniref:helix-turn-helix domain-containing protein n=1 Tax=Hydrogenophaga sp. T2 TaxID=3132823 RepID=UPI003CE7AF87
MPASSPRYADDPALVALGAAIRRLRTARGISQEELAHRCAIDRAYMSSIERGKQNAGVMTLLGIAAALEITAAQLLHEAQL